MHTAQRWSLSVRASRVKAPQLLAIAATIVFWDSNSKREGGDAPGDPEQTLSAASAGGTAWCGTLPNARLLVKAVAVKQRVASYVAVML